MSNLSIYDEELEKTIERDMSEIWKECGGQCGVYENFPISRIYRDKESIRCYALDSGGGICIMTYLDRRYGNKYQILTLGEDDGWHFLNSADTYCRYYKSKLDFVSLLFEAVSLFNNEVYDN